MENTKIEWADHTFNPWIGCTKVSDGCKYCYAEAMMDKRFGHVQWGPQGQRMRTSASNWHKPLAWNRKAEKEGRRYTVFCASLADVFEVHKTQNQELDYWRDDLFKLVETTPFLNWLFLTKHPENVITCIGCTSGLIERHPGDWLRSHPNVWIGISAENQEMYEKRVEHLVKIPAVVRFVSAEPLLGRIDMDLSGKWYGRDSLNEMVNWVIVGGESGPNARPMHPDWVRSIRDQCQEAGVPFLFKQWGRWAPDCLCNTPKPHKATSRPEPGKPGVMFSCGKKNAGRLIDDSWWNEIPFTVQGA
ncbi:MAG TPA: phage Gp37/Gp68 family protein [Anaerolineae bacterium]|nr:phage Gp37/Gp68 family protein [Anaerolineae bacterium]